MRKYAAKLSGAGLAAKSGPGSPLVGGLDDELVWNREDPDAAVLSGVFERLNINALAMLTPLEPYRSAINYLSERADSVRPEDCETRTFLHDLPVIGEFTAEAVASALKRRKGVIIKGRGIAAHGSVSPEQAFVTLSSICFACFVKFFADYLKAVRENTADAAMRQAFERAAAALPPLPESFPPLAKGPFASRAEVHAAMIEAGRLTVDYGLVDSYFGNLSYLLDDTLYISQTGSSLDELEGVIDPCPLDGSSCAGLTASSELIAHERAILKTGASAILHGHPKFAVILSMDCGREDCPHKDRCHVDCPEARSVGDIPIAPGEVGAGPRGLCNTMPRALVGHRGAIVLGHGLFTTGREDFNEAFATMLDVEKMCRERYFRLIAEDRNQKEDS